MLIQFGKSAKNKVCQKMKCLKLYEKYKKGPGMINIFHKIELNQRKSYIFLP